MELDFQSLRTGVRSRPAGSSPFAACAGTAGAAGRTGTGGPAIPADARPIRRDGPGGVRWKRKGVRSTSGLTGGDGYRMQQAARNGGLTGPVIHHALARALAVSEWNAAMGRIVAAPTAGSCGIYPRQC